MKKTTKILFCITLCCTLLLSGLPFSVIGDFTITASAAEEGFYTYEINDGEATITGVDDTISGNVTIPSKLGGYPVTSIGSWAFYNCTGLTTITIPDSVTSIEDSAFSGCTGLTTITIPDSVTSIGYAAFYNCTSLTAITIPDSVTSIGSSAFSGCTGLTAITIPDSVTSIGNYAFYGCTGLTAITIPDSVTSIGSWAFEDCTGLTAITIPDSVTSIEDSAFEGCTGLTTITIPDSVTSIGSSAFYNCTGLTAITIPDSVTSIGSWAFRDCTGLTAITIPDSVTSIGDAAFSCCTGLTTITIPDSVTSIGSSAFYGTAYYENSDNWTNGLLYIGNYLIEAKSDISGKIDIKAGTKRIATSAFSGCTGLTAVTIPDSVTSIGSSAFSGCTGLTTITIPDSVTSIGGSSFSNCTSLTQINLSNNLSEIGQGAFEKCEKLLNIVFPQTLKSIGSAAFYNCSALSSIVFPNNLQSIGQAAFHGCSNIEGEINIPATVKEIGSIAYRNVFDDCYKITAINVDKNNTAYKSENGVLFSKDGKTLFVYPAGKTQTSYEIPSSVETVGYDAFSNNHFVKAVKIPESVKLIDSCAFMNCTSLCDIEIPITVEELGGDIFVGCENLDSLKFLSICCHIPYGKSTLGLKEGTTVYGYNNSSIEIFIKDYIIRDYGEEYYKFVSLGDYDGEVFTITSGDINENVAYRLDCTGKLTISGTGNISESFEFPSENSNNVLYLVIEEGIAENNNSFSVLYNLQSATFAKSVTKTVGLVLFRIKKLIFLNADVEILGLNYCNPTIYGYNDSTAEAYADKYGCTFVELKEIHSHSYTSSITKNATCKESGVTTFTCSCGDTYSEEIAKLTTHIWGNWTVTSAATYEATGTEKRTCTVCEKTESRTIAKLEYKDIVLINTEEMKVFGDDNVISVDGKTVNDLLKNIKGNVSITNKDGKIVSGEDIITSGMTVTLKDKNGKVLDSKTVVVLGDNNGDGKITANDARTALRASVALDKLNSWQTAASNVEKMAESKITAADARLILRASVGLEDLSVQLKTIR